MGASERFVFAASWARRGLAFQSPRIASPGATPASGHRRSVIRGIDCLGPAGPVARISLAAPAVAVAVAGPAEDDALLEAVVGLVAGDLEADRLAWELLAQVVAGLDAMTRRMVEARIAVDTVIEPGLPPVHLDGERFERVLVHLVASARHAIDVARGNEQARIVIAFVLPVASPAA